VYRPTVTSKESARAVCNENNKWADAYTLDIGEGSRVQLLSFDQLRRRPFIIASLIAISSAATLFLNAYGLGQGITDVLPHLLYVPIILTAYYFPRRALYFTAILSGIYCALVFGITGSTVSLLSSLERSLVFLLITGVVSYLSSQLHEDAERCMRLALVVQSSTDAIIGKSLDGEITDWNHGAELVYGYTAAEAIGKPVSIILPPGRQDELTLILEKIKNGEPVQRYETERMTKTGRNITVSLLVSPIIDFRDQIIGVSTIAHDITERRRLQDSILRAKNEWELTFDAVPDMITIIDRDFHILRINRAMSERLGISPEEVQGRKCFELVHGLNEPLGVCPHSLLLNDGKTHSGEVHEERLNADFRVTVSPLLDPSGGIRGSVHVMQDITESKRADKALRDSNQRFSDIVNFLPDPTFVINADGIIIAWNRALEAMSRIPAPEMMGKGGYAYSEWFYGTRRPILIDFVLRQDFPSIQREYPSFQTEGAIVKTESSMTRPDGTTLSLWVTSTPLYDPQGAIVGAIESIRDVTDVKRIQRALRESKKYLDKIINTLADPVFVKDRNHNFVLVNDAFCSFTGHTREALTGKSDYDFFKREEAEVFWQTDEEVFRTGAENENQESITDASGTVHAIITKKTRYTDTFGEEFIVGIIRDVTSIKQIEEALHLTNKKLNMLSSITRHDIVNNLTGLRTYLELSKDIVTDPVILDYIRKEDDAADAIGRQIEFTRYYQDIGVHAPEWQDAASLIRSAASQLPLKAIEIDIEVPPVQVYADFLIEKVFYNLMENSIRHGGNVTRIQFSFAETDEGGVLAYSDNGVGISPEDKQRLFTRGFGKHTGLGLFLSREILLITGISIEETGVFGKGVRFEILIPKERYRPTSSGETGGKV
jgi:PAS domain S-box-containing protein